MAQKYAVEYRRLNNYSPTLFKEVYGRENTFGPGDIAVFKRLFGGTSVERPVDISGDVNPVAPMLVRDRETIVTPSGQQVTVALIKDVVVDSDSEGNQRDRIIYDRIEFNERNGHTVVLHGDKPLHRKYYEYLMLVDQNASKPGRNRSVRARFVMDDPVKKAVAALTDGQAKAKAMTAWSELSTQEAQAALLKLGGKSVRQGSMSDDDYNAVVKEALLDKIMDNPRKFLDVMEDSSRVEATVLQAIEEKVIRHYKTDGAWKWYDSKEIFLEVPTDEDPVSYLVSHIGSSPKGAEVFAAIKSKL